MSQTIVAGIVANPAISSHVLILVPYHDCGHIRQFSVHGMLMRESVVKAPVEGPRRPNVALSSYRFDRQFTLRGCCRAHAPVFYYNITSNNFLDLTQAGLPTFYIQHYHQYAPLCLARVVTGPRYGRDDTLSGGRGTHGQEDD